MGRQLLGFICLYVAILIAVSAGTVAHAEKVPHVTECNFCKQCDIVSPPESQQADATRRFRNLKSIQSDLSILLRHAMLEEAASLTPQVKQNSKHRHAQHTAALKTGSQADMEVRTLPHSHTHSNPVLTADGTEQLDSGHSHLIADRQQSTNARRLAAGGHHARLNTLGDAMNDPEKPPELRWSSYLATANDVVPKQTLPNCTRCQGCTTTLIEMNSASYFFDRTYTNEKGATSSWLFRATTSKQPSGMAVVKIYCLPLPKREGGKVPTCSPVTVLRNMMLHLALERISTDCGLDDIIPKVWVDKIDAVTPDVGYHVRWYGLWMELIAGVSLENFLNKGEPTRLPPNMVLDVMHNKLNKTQVIRAAIFDLLTSQCDRHSQNIFISEDGQIKLIDNESCLQKWPTCGFDSILIPTTQKQEIVRMSNQFILKYVTAAEAPKGDADPQLLLDYRCYVSGGEAIGTNYPPKVTQCLKKISEMTPDEVQSHYQLADSLAARNLHSRATDMLYKGFEWSYKYGEPRNAPPKRYLVQPKCCKVQWRDTMYRCAEPYNPIYELPIGDPVTGREWQKPKPDIGTFEGGTRY